MELTLTVTKSKTLPEESLEAFVEKAKRLGKEPSEFLAEIITREALRPSPKKKGLRK